MIYIHIWHPYKNEKWCATANRLTFAARGATCNGADSPILPTSQGGLLCGKQQIYCQQQVRPDQQQQRPQQRATTAYTQRDEMPRWAKGINATHAHPLSHTHTQRDTTTTTTTTTTNHHHHYHYYKVHHDHQGHHHDYTHSLNDDDHAYNHMEWGLN